MLTPLGRQIRRLRLDKAVRLKDMAEAFEVTSSFLSAVENGRKAMPEEWYDKLESYFAGFGVSRSGWAKLVDESKSKMVMDLARASSIDRETAYVFGRHYLSLPADKKQRIRKLLSGDS